MSEKIQCEGCLGYCEETKELCPECQAKAASYDITLMERNSLEMALRIALANLEDSNFIPELKGRLRTALEFNCIRCPECNSENKGKGTLCAMHERAKIKAKVG